MAFFSRHGPLLIGHVGQERAADHVAGRIDAGDAGGHAGVHTDVSFGVGVQAGGIQPEAPGDGAPPDGEQHPLRLDAPLAVTGLHQQTVTLRRALDALEGGAGENVHTATGQGAGEEAADRLVLAGGNAGQGLDHRHASTEAVKNRRELQPDGAAAHDGDAAGGRLKGESGIAVEQRRVVGAGQLQGAGGGAGGDDDGVGRQLADGAGLAAHQDPVRTHQAAAARHHLDAGLAQQAGDACAQGLHHAVLAAEEERHVHRRLTHNNAKGGGVLDRLQHPDALQQRLGRDAAAVEAGAAQVVPFHQGDGATQSGCPQGGHITGGTAADDQDATHS